MLPFRAHTHGTDIVVTLETPGTRTGSVMHAIHACIATDNAHASETHRFTCAVECTPPIRRKTSPKSISDALNAFHAWVRKYEAPYFFWGMSAHIEYAIYSEAMHLCGDAVTPTPFDEWNVRDIRTVMDLARVNKVCGSGTVIENTCALHVAWNRLKCAYEDDEDNEDGGSARRAAVTNVRAGFLCGVVFSYVVYCMGLMYSVYKLK
jgi:hypothetical protein